MRSTGSDITPLLSLSIVSHGHGNMVVELLSDIKQYCSLPKEVLLTINVPEKLLFKPEDFDFPVTIISNEYPCGFGANHNAAFKRSRGEYFCILNPDIRLRNDPFPELVCELSASRVGAVAPLLYDSSGTPQSNARPFPTPELILKKLLFGDRIGMDSLYGAVDPDWIAGMFILFRREQYMCVGGFDERFYLYYEDVDICARLLLAGYRVKQSRSASAIHNPQCDSHRKPRYLFWHLASMLRFFRSPAFRCVIGKGSDR